MSTDSVTDPVPYMDINGNLEMRHDPERNRLHYWDSVYERYNGQLMGAGNSV